MSSFTEQRNGPSSARRAMFVVLMVVSLALVGVYGQEGDGGPLHSVQARINDVTGTVSSVGSGIGAGTQRAGAALENATADPSTLEGLRQQNEELRQMLAEADEYRQEVDRLRGLLDIKQVSGVQGPVARVIGSSTNAWDRSITIDLGTEDGVASGMTVMGATGVIGQVSRAGDHTSTVRLLTDPNSGAAVMVQSSRANGIVRGSLSGLLYLEDVDEDKVPEVGDVIITSGLGGSYERGLIVGAVASVGDPTVGVGDIVINPNATVKMLEEVIVVFKAPQVSVSASGVTDEAGTQVQGEVSSDDVTAQPQEEQGVVELQDEWQEEEGYEENADAEVYVDPEGYAEPEEYVEG